MVRAPNLIFYSWQSDLPNATNRGFIEKALENAAKLLQSDRSLVIDRDTAGIPGSPEIASTILGKIDQAQVFVCDISIINQGTGRPTPNPNVLLELGYALHALGEHRIIMVFNDAFGKLDLLPFDLRTRRAVCYHMPVNVADRATERRRLSDVLAEGLRIILNELDTALPGETIPPLSLAAQAQSALENTRPNQATLVKQYMTELTNKIDELTPTFSDSEQGKWDEQLLQAIEQLSDKIIEFAQLAQTIAQMNATAAAHSMYHGFSGILDLYIPSRALRYHTFDHDLAKFLGQELFVIFFSCLLQEGCWELIVELLDDDLYARTENFGHPRAVPFYELSEPILLLDEVRKQRLKSNRISLYADLLNERHTQGDLAKCIPMVQFAEADYFLFLRAQLQPATVTSRWPLWMPWSSLYMGHLPRYLEEAKRAKFAQRLLRPLGVEDIPTLRNRLAERTGSLEQAWGAAGIFSIWDNALAGFDFNTIGSR